MSSHWIIRCSIYTLVCVAMLTYGLLQTSYAQGKRPVRGGPPDAGEALGEQPRRGERPDSVGDRSGRGDQRPGANRNDGRDEDDNDREETRTSKPKFENLLDSKDLSQFRGYAQEEIGEGWSLDGKYLYFDGSGGGDVITKDVYSDFDLQVEWKVADGGNSGIMYRVSLGDDAPYKSGPEYQILDDAEHGDGKNEITAVGSLYGMFAGQEREVKAAGSWNKTRIVVEGNKIQHFLNGNRILEAEIGSDEWNKQLADSKFKDWEKFAKNTEGHIAFQDHGGEIWFRNIRIKRLSGSDGADDEDVADGRPAAARGSKWEQMQAGAPGAPGAPDSGASKKGASKAPRGSKFEGMQSNAPGSDKNEGPDK